MKKVLSLFLTFIFVLACASPVCFGVDGYHIGTQGDFVRFANEVRNGNNFYGRRVILDADLDLVYGYGSNRNNIMVGTLETPFCGIFDGNGHSVQVGISGFNGDVENLGLFRFAQFATFMNLNVFGSVSGLRNIGAILGMGDNVQFINCHNFANISGSDNVGALAGHCTAHVRNCTNNGTVSQNGLLVNNIDGAENFIGSMAGWRIAARRRG